MKKFEVQEDFLLDGKPFKIMSGAIHYFRVLPEDWYHSLYNLKALGFNTVETYIPWNVHEAKEGEYDFSGRYDIKRFVETAEELGLLVILRPSPYICAEWEFGGLPAWLLPYKDMRIRSSDPAFMEKVSRYYEKLFEVITPLQLDHGGPVIMMQVENEYGSYGEDKEYLKLLYDLMLKLGVTVPIFTSDGAWRATQEAGTLTEANILTTGNFGSRSKENFKDLKDFHESKGKKWPLMCMEFWDGWFNRWNDPIIKRDGQDLAHDVKEALEIGSVNLYMFHGGTNFGLMNGCSARGRTDLPQVTSYDYDAPLNEQGNPTEKYYALQKMMQELFPDSEQQEPLVKDSMELKAIPLNQKVSLFSVIDEIVEKQQAKYPETMEELGQQYGYTLYRSRVKKDSNEEFYRVIDGSDRVQFFFNEEKKATQYQEEIGEKIYIAPKNDVNQLDVLVENMGRVNYGHKLLADTQQKGIRTGIMSDLHFILDWEHYCLEFTKPLSIDYDKKWKENTPSFYRYTPTIDEPKDTFINMESFGKGIVLVNGFNIGRYWNVGPTLSLYVPKSLLQKGENEIVVFETEGIWSEMISLEKEPKFKKL
ncbi:beta-galactosidase [Carnobacterium sp. CS13]|uniref:glycoside hydrolase family 35 protein n=1 Tax=Carnobacterium sp. CS13 TaxID=2800128 RepID=UPI001911A3C7|nr:beta-galactosidase family protein [Carnobacterium sp. CS13]QQP69684.1 beta-galactosidase [Carnobacterium sp. CS13]